MIHKFFDDSNYSLYLCTVILNSRISFISFKWGQYVLFCSSRWNMINLTAMKAFPIFSIRNWGLNLIFSNSYFLFLPTEHKQYIIGLIGRNAPVVAMGRKLHKATHCMDFRACSVHVLSTWRFPECAHYFFAPDALPIRGVTHLSEVFPQRLGGSVLFAFCSLLL